MSILDMKFSTTTCVFLIAAGAASGHSPRENINGLHADILGNRPIAGHIFHVTKLPSTAEKSRVLSPEKGYGIFDSSIGSVCWKDSNGVVGGLESDVFSPANTVASMYSMRAEILLPRKNCQLRTEGDKFVSFPWSLVGKKSSEASNLLLNSRQVAFSNWSSAKQSAQGRSCRFYEAETETKKAAYYFTTYLRIGVCGGVVKFVGLTHMKTT